ncbi:MAG: hypothetical protein N4A70_05445 [Pelagimonas sp.]|jgi:hypothetical protein|nr:hypothetical protein [Pelagimonas sp.]
MTGLTQYDLSACGGPDRITVSELTAHVVTAKCKVKSSARGWSSLSQVELIALAWFADLFLEDGEAAAPIPAQPEPAVISNV